jgi:hypothetical protein
MVLSPTLACEASHGEWGAAPGWPFFCAVFAAPGKRSTSPADLMWVDG